MPSKSDKTTTKVNKVNTVKKSSKTSNDTKSIVKPKLEKINRDKIIDTFQYSKQMSHNSSVGTNFNTSVGTILDYPFQDEEGNRYDLTLNQTGRSDDNSDNLSDMHSEDYIQEYI